MAHYPATSSVPSECDAVSDAAGALCDRHGLSLYLLALTVTGSPALARAAVAEVISDACRRGEHPGLADPRDVRRELARRVYDACASRGDPVGFDPAVRPLLFEDFMAWLGPLSGYQRAAIGLCRYGEHRAWQVADLLGVSTATVHELIFWGLQDLAQRARGCGGRPLVSSRVTGAAHRGTPRGPAGRPL